MGIQKHPRCTWKHQRGCTSTSLLALICVLHNKVPASRLFKGNTHQRHCSWLHVEAQNSSASFPAGFTPCWGTTRRFLFVFFENSTTTMTFRRLKKVNSSAPESGPSSQDDIYFPSSKSDSCRTVDVPTNSSEVYNYKTLAYSGGTLPRNFKKVRGQLKLLLSSVH